MTAAVPPLAEKPPRAATPSGGLSSRPWWPWLKRGLTLAFFVLVAWLLVSHAREIRWADVGSALQRLPLAALGLAGLFAAASFTLYSTFDLLGRLATGHRLSAPQVMAVTFISYAFNLSLGSLVGGVALRFRLYSRFGLDNGVITRVVGISMFTNWLGYVFLGGLVCLLHPPELPAGWPIDTAMLRPLGAVLAVLPLGYLLACAFAKRRDWQIRGHAFTLPSVRFAMTQLVVSSINWLLIGATVHALLQQRVDFASVLGVLLLAAVAGLLTHVPAGLGVLEAVFVALLSSRIPEGELLGALLAYRGVYYLVPLAVAALLYLTMETLARKGPPPGSG